MINKVDKSIYYKHKCGQTVSAHGFKYMFLGYVEQKQCMLADRAGNKHITWLNEIS